MLLMSRLYEYILTVQINMTSDSLTFLFNGDMKMRSFHVMHNSTKLKSHQLHAFGCQQKMCFTPPSSGKIEY